MDENWYTNKSVWSLSFFYPDPQEELKKEKKKQEMYGVRRKPLIGSWAWPSSHQAPQSPKGGAMMWREAQARPKIDSRASGRAAGRH